MGKIGCVAIVKNEERHIAEWLAWQFFLGFDTVFLLDNGSTDATAAVARSFKTQYDVRLLDYPNEAPDYQLRGYEMLAREVAPDFEWLAFFDADEFLRLDEGLSLKAALAGRQEAAIAIPWAIFGSSGHQNFPPGLVIENFTRRSTPDFPPNHHVKSIIRPQLMERAVNPHAFQMRGEYADLAGRRVAWGHTPGVLAHRPDYAGGALHHYFVRSVAHWREKLARGYHDLTRPDDEFFMYDRNEVEDRSLALHAPKINSMIETLFSHPARAPKVAVVLMVKEESHDILAWLAWYRLLGFDAAIVYDDDSTDGTWDILQEAARHWDIRLSRTTGPKGPAHNGRQVESYKTALKTYKDEFDWLAFFDADEFLQLRQDQNVKQFLARFPQAEQVSVNWCNYGSSGHILKPDLPAPLAYRWHGAAHRGINRHVKSFVRPRAVGSAWINVHYFDVPAGRTVLPNGQPPQWNENIGIISGEPDWSVAKLMHYQCRSMEHFIERLKKRPQFQKIPNLWQAYDVKDEADDTPQAMAEALLASIAALKGPGAAAAAPIAAEAAPNHLVFFIGDTPPDLIEASLTAEEKIVAVQPDARIYYALQERFAEAVSSGQLALENYAPAPRGGEIALLQPNDGSRAYPVATIGWQELIAKHGQPGRVELKSEIPGYPPPRGEPNITAKPASPPKTIFDIGMAEGNDTAYYLAKGFNVVGVEGDVQTYQDLLRRFAPEIAGGRLVIHNNAAAARTGETVEFFHHEQHPGISGLSNSRAEFSSGYKSFFVPTINWPSLIAAHGVPYYMKIDIEGGEAAFLSSAARETLPEYISVECYSLAPVETLRQLGYRRFMLVDQNPPGGFSLPQPQHEGNTLATWKWSHNSGPFGRDLTGEWVDFETFKTAWEASREQWARTWFDCHAALR